MENPFPQNALIVVSIAAQQSVAADNRSCHVACLRKRRAKTPPLMVMRIMGKEDSNLVGFNVKVKAAANALAAERQPLGVINIYQVSRKSD